MWLRRGSGDLRQSSGKRKAEVTEGKTCIRASWVWTRDDQEDKRDDGTRLWCTPMPGPRDVLEERKGPQ